MQCCRWYQNSTGGFFRPPRHSHAHFPFLRGGSFWSLTLSICPKTSAWQKNASRWCFWMLRFNTVLEPLTRTVPRPGRKASKSETRWTRRELWLWPQPSCLSDPQNPEGWEGAAGKRCTHLLLWHLLSAPTGVAGQPQFGHPSARIWAPKDPPGRSCLSQRGWEESGAQGGCAP